MGKSENRVTALYELVLNEGVHITGKVNLYKHVEGDLVNEINTA